MIQLLDRRPEGARRCERPDVQLVDDQFGKRRRAPTGILPMVVARINHLGGTMHSVRVET
jgi:hypothetical protein